MKNVTRFLTRVMLLLALSTMLFLQEGLALATHDIGVQTTTSPFPFYTYAAGARVQYCYFASELIAGGLMPGQVTALGYNCITLADTPNLGDLTFSMKNATGTGVDFGTTGFTTVWTGPPCSPAHTGGYTFTQGWNTFTFSTPFTWDGTSNIIITVCYNDAGYGNDYGNLVAAYPTGTANPPYGCLLNYTFSTGLGCGLTTAAYYTTVKPVIGLTQPNGTISGTVTDFMTTSPILGATVTGGGGSATTNVSGFYTFSANSGTSNYTATYTGYIPLTKSATVPVNGATTLNFELHPMPATLTGHITNFTPPNSGIKGAKIVVNGGANPYTYSIDPNGYYTLDFLPGGTFTVTFTKAGFQDTTTTAINMVGGTTTTLNMAMLESANPASQPFTAALNSGATLVNLNWGLPVGKYELIYDDGTQELSTVWGSSHNKNAMKFTPLAYPVTIVSGSVNIGPSSDYDPSITSPSQISPFTIQVYDASGTGGTPGAAIGSPATVTPTSFGWNTFTINNVSITSGNFYLVMIQDSIPPFAARLGQDTTTTQLRAFSKFGNGPWLPANGNFMIRAVVQGTGGPIDSPQGTTGYQVYRLFQTYETQPGTWVPVSAPTTTSTTDPSWPSLVALHADSAYRWAVKAHYYLNRWSTPIFSNVLGINRTANVVVTVTPTCSATSLDGSLVKLTCTQTGVDSVYSKLTDATGTVTFPTVWKGAYLLTVTRDGYTAYSANVSIYGDHTYNISLRSQTPAPSKPLVDAQSLKVTWSPPALVYYGLDEDFADFTTNGWDDSGYWTINPSFGNPSPCAELPWTYALTNYDNLNLVSKSLIGYGASSYHLSYDIYLNNFASTGLEQLEVELQVNGAGPWINLAHYANTASIPWTSEDFDLAAYTNSVIKIRFRAHGADMFDFNYWDVDNVKVGVPHVGFDPKPCILGYNVYLNTTTQIGSTTDTTFTIPNALIVYGNTYNACVEAVYGSGTSSRICSDPFIARWLCPPTDLAGEVLQTDVHLTWKKPDCGGCTLGTYIYDNSTMGDGFAYGTGATIYIGNYFPIPATTTGILKSFDMYFMSTPGLTSAQPCVIYVFDAAYNLIGQSASFLNTGAAYPSGTWVNVPMPNTPYVGPFYALVDYSITSAPYKNWFSVDITTPQPGYPQGLAWADLNGVFQPAAPLWLYAPPVTFLQHANVCHSGKDKDGAITTIDPTQLPPSMNVTSAPSAAAVRLGTFANVKVDQPVTPSAPANVPPALLGYNVYRNGNHLGANPTVNDPNTLDYWDLHLNPGVYDYTVTGFYDVNPIAPYLDNSAAAGPVELVINYGRPLPFFEPWDMGTFAFNSWYHTPGDNWSINTGFGNPAPCADFSFDTPHPLTNYSDTLRSVTFTAAPYTCAKIYLDFDYKLLDHNHTGAELLDVEEFVGGTWKKIAEFANNGDVNWTSQHFELKQTIGKAFMIQFRANGVNSLDMLHWYVDNIHLYAVCTPPTALTYTEEHNSVKLTWTAPNCNPAHLVTYIFDDDSEENGWSFYAGNDYKIGNLFPIDPSANGVIQSFDMEFQQTSGLTNPVSTTVTVYDLSYNILGVTPAFINNAGWVTVTAPDIPFSGPFYAMVDYYQPSLISNFFNIDEDGPYSNYGGVGLAYYVQGGTTWGTTGDATFLGNPGVWMQRATCLVNGKKMVMQPSSVPPKPTTKPAGHSGVGMQVAKAVHSYPRPVYDPSTTSSASLQGYNVWRTDSTGSGTFHKLNPGIVSGLSYTDLIPLVGWGIYDYYVTSVYNDTISNTFLCESPGSDTVIVHFPAVGIQEIGNGQISVYPNPANDVVNIVSSNDIKTIEVLNYIGQTIYTNNNISLKKVELNVTSFKSGVYFVKITTTNGIKTTKVTVTH